MLKMKKLESNQNADSFFFSKKELERYIIYDAGEITRVEVSYTMDTGNKKFFDSKGLMFVCTYRIGRARCGYDGVSFYGIDRDDVVPHQFSKDAYSDDYSIRREFLCNDPRVVWVDIVSAWALSNLSVGEAVLNKIITENLPSIQNAVRWLTKNKFVPFATQYCEAGVYGIAPDDVEYYSEYNELYYPPEIDWDRYNISIPKERGITVK